MAAETLNRKGVVLWLTGLSGSGKSTISEALQRYFNRVSVQSYILDGDKIRTGLCTDLGFSPEDRTENIRRIGEVAKILCDAKIVTIVAFISPYKSDRDRVRSILEPGQFVEIYVDCPIEECEKRDPKGLYKKARAGEIKDFTGISAPYESPEKPEIHLQTHSSSVDDCVEHVVHYVEGLDVYVRQYKTSS